MVNFTSSSLQSSMQESNYYFVDIHVFTLASYRHAGDGVLRVFREEGVSKLFNGVEWAAPRAALMTIGQLVFYDVGKRQLLKTKYFKDNLVTHFASSLFAVSRLSFSLL